MHLQGGCVQVSFLYRIVPLPHLLRLMAYDLHSRCGVHSCPPHIDRRTVPKIMKPEVRDTASVKAVRNDRLIRCRGFPREDMLVHQATDLRQPLKG